LIKAGQPWETAKVFKISAILGPWRPLESLDRAMTIEFSLSVNDQIRQRGRGQDMRWKPLDLLRDLERFFPLCEGDLLFTGTPEGVGPLSDGDRLQVRGGDISYAFTCRRR
jgi:fumarylpyruvate hydrolase